MAAPSANLSSKVSAVSSSDVKDDFGKKGLGNSTKSTTNPYLENRSSRSREAQRHSRSPSDGMILTASGLTLDPSNPEFEKEVTKLCN